MENTLFMWFVKHKVAVILVLVLVLLGGYGVWKYKISIASQESIEKTSLTAAKQYCGDHHEASVCDSLQLAKTEQSDPYGPTDGNDIYSGNWFVTFSPKDDATKRIFVASDISGRVLYVNTSSQHEYPYKDK